MTPPSDGAVVAIPEVSGLHPSVDTQKRPLMDT